MEVDAFLYVIVMVLAIIVVIQQGALNAIKVRTEILESQVRELHKMVIRILPDEE